MKLSAVVPCYNDEEVLHALVGRLRSVFGAQDWDYEILFVDDGSGDGTWRSIRELSVADNHIIGIRLSRNHGHQLALAAGMAQAAGDRILTIDSDLQDPPELVPEMMKLMDAGADVLYMDSVDRGRACRLGRNSPTKLSTNCCRNSQAPIFRLTRATSG
jgi:glycosyltransferase involved in cell wall biosynthesis